MSILTDTQREALEAPMVARGRPLRQQLITAIRSCGIELSPDAYGNLGLPELYAIARYLLTQDTLARARDARLRGLVGEMREWADGTADIGGHGDAVDAYRECAAALTAALEGK